MRRERQSGRLLPALASASLKFAITLACLGFATSARAECNREMLKGLADTYVKAQTDGKAGLLPLAQGASYAENDRAMDIGKGVLAGPLKVDFTRSLHDTTQCVTFTELVAATDPHPYVIHTRIEATQDGKVSKMESVVTDDDDWVFGADAFLTHTRAETWDEIPVGERDRREVIQAAAEAYIDNWGDPKLPVPHGTPCARLEGRIYTASRDPQGQTCTMGAFPQPIKRATGATSSTRPSEPCPSSTISRGSTPASPPTTREPRPARRSGSRLARIATSTR